MARPTTGKRGYDKAWQRVRARYLASHPICAVCHQRAVDVDHRVPIRVAPNRRLDPSNLVAFCHHHHSHVTAGFDSGRLRGACDADGNPADPLHPWAADTNDHLVGTTHQDSVRRPKAVVVLRDLKADWLRRWASED